MLANVRNAPGTIVTEPQATPRGETASVNWDGGDPTVDGRRAGFVVVERQQGLDWVEVDRDGPGSVLVRFRRTADANRWTAEWRSPALAVPGTYPLPHRRARLRSKPPADRNAGTSGLSAPRPGLGDAPYEAITTIWPPSTYDRRQPLGVELSDDAEVLRAPPEVLLVEAQTFQRVHQPQQTRTSATGAQVSDKSLVVGRVGGVELCGPAVG